MKKTLLLSAAIMAASTVFAAPGITKAGLQPMRMSTPAVSRADESMIFSYVSGEVQMYGLGASAKQHVYTGTTIDPADVEALAGNSITNLTFIAPTNQNYQNQIKTATIFISEGLDKAPVYTQDVSLSSDGYIENLFELNTPYVIQSGKPLIIGWTFDMVNGMYILPADGDTSVPKERTVFAVTNASETAFPTSGWQEAGDQCGNFALYMTVTGDKLPQNRAKLLSLTPNASYQPNVDGAINLSVLNTGANPVSSIKVKVTPEGGSATELTATADTPIKNMESATVKVNGVKMPAVGLNKKMDVELVEVNGAAYNGATLSGTTNVFEGGWDANLIIEEITGTWCGWCPRGYAWLEYIRDTYPDRFLRVAAHNGDVMEVSSYNTVFTHAGINGLPGAVINRKYDPQLGLGYTFPQLKDMAKYYLDLITSSNSYGNVDLKFTEVDGSFAKLAISADVEFALDIDEQNYISFVVTEDNVGPYKQTNYYAGQNIDMDGWESKSRSVSTIYNDVARAFERYPGIKNGLPKTVKKGEKYHVDYELETGKLASNKYNVIAILTNKQGEVINATLVKSPNYDVAIDTIDSDVENVTVNAANGAINVNGASNVAVYTLDGRRVAMNGLTAGLYIVVADGQSYKVVVR